MKAQNNILLIGIFLACLIDLGLAQNCTNKKPTLTTGQTYIANQNCTKGPTYDNNSTTPTQHCSCWAHCGYKCSPKTIRTTTTKAPVTGSTTKAPCKTPTVPTGSKWVANVGCSNGPTYNIDTAPKYHCHCQSFCGYICDPRP